MQKCIIRFADTILYFQVFPLFIDDETREENTFDSIITGKSQFERKIKGFSKF